MSDDRVAVVQAEGARIAIWTCPECGAAVLIDPRDDFDPAYRHREWHRETKRAEEDR